MRVYIVYEVFMNYKGVIRKICLTEIGANNFVKKNKLFSPEYGKFIIQREIGLFSNLYYLKVINQNIIHLENEELEKSNNEKFKRLMKKMDKIWFGYKYNQKKSEEKIGCFNSGKW